MNRIQDYFQLQPADRVARALGIVDFCDVIVRLHVDTGSQSRDLTALTRLRWIALAVIEMRGLGAPNVS